MNIVKIHSGLGNQMFQYAFYLAMRHHHPDTKIDTSVYANRPSHNGYELERVFAIHPNHATLAERDRLADVGKDWFSELRRAIGWKRRTTGQLVTEPDPSSGWSADIWQVTDSYLQGYWQSERYFADITDEVREAFTFRLPLPKQAEPWAQSIQSSRDSVSVHVRRGDYLKPRRRDDFEVCTENYYRRAVRLAQERLQDPVFYVFSDESRWVSEQKWFPEGTVYVSGNNGEQAYVDMQLMSICRHHIIANSSFSWWAAWLGQYEDTVTFAPAVWFHHHPRPDILPNQWIPVDVR